MMRGEGCTLWDGRHTKEACASQGSQGEHMAAPPEQAKKEDNAQKTAHRVLGPPTSVCRNRHDWGMRRRWVPFSRAPDAARSEFWSACR